MSTGPHELNKHLTKSNFWCASKCICNVWNYYWRHYEVSSRLQLFFDWGSAFLQRSKEQRTTWLGGGSTAQTRLQIWVRCFRSNVTCSAHTSRHFQTELQKFHDDAHGDAGSAVDKQRSTLFLFPLWHIHDMLQFAFDDNSQLLKFETHWQNFL